MKVFLTKINESWIVDRIREEFYKNNKEIVTNSIKKADIVWIIAPWMWDKLDFKKIKNKKIICSIYHLDTKELGKEEVNRFNEYDQFVDEYHTISIKSKEQIERFTDKPVNQIPFWVNTNKFFYIEDKTSLKKKYNFTTESFLVGSFQRDSEGSDLTKPKLIKGPDIFLEIVSRLNNEKKNLEVVLTGKRRDYLINNLKNLGIKYRYFEMLKLKNLNELYNLLDLYIVSSRVEGGPQAIVECATSNTPIISSNVGVAQQILSKESIFEVENVSSFFTAKPNLDYAKKMVYQHETPQGFDPFLKMLTDIYES
jgi:glycosyltransferase involved in cell wall biosynthesis